MQAECKVTEGVVELLLFLRRSTFQGQANERPCCSEFMALPSDKFSQRPSLGLLHKLGEPQDLPRQS